MENLSDQLAKKPETLQEGYQATVEVFSNRGSDENGDRCSAFTATRGLQYVIICDGMGTGQNANVESVRVVKLFKTLILSGFKPQSVLKIINGGMLSDGREERCVSFDCLSVDLFTGRADFIKAGAVASIVKTAGDVNIIRENSIPLGVLDIDSVPVKSLFLGGDSYIIMMTDGVADNIGDRKKGEECVGSIVKLMELKSSKEISDNIMMSAVAEGIPKDDMLVTAIKISGKDI